MTNIFNQTGFGQRLKEVRTDQLDLSQSELAEACGVARQTIQNYERSNRKLPPTDHLEQLLKTVADLGGDALYIKTGIRAQRMAAMSLDVAAATAAAMADKVATGLRRVLALLPPHDAPIDLPRRWLDQINGQDMAYCISLDDAGVVPKYSLVLVDKVSSAANDGVYVFAVGDADDLQIRRLQRLGDGRLAVLSAPPYLEQRLGTDELRLVGRVVATLQFTAF